MTAPARLSGLTPDQIAALGKEHGWVVLRADQWLTLRRTHTLTTPPGVLCTQQEHARGGFGGWPEPTYQAHEFLSFFFKPAGDTWKLRGQIVYGDAVAPWVGRRDSNATQQRALEILTAPPPDDYWAGQAGTGGAA